MFSLNYLSSCVNNSDCVLTVDRFRKNSRVIEMDISIFEKAQKNTNYK